MCNKVDGTAMIDDVLKFTRWKRLFESILEFDDSMRDKLTVNALVYHDTKTDTGASSGQPCVVAAR